MHTWYQVHASSQGGRRSENSFERREAMVGKEKYRKSAHAEVIHCSQQMRHPSMSSVRTIPQAISSTSSYYSSTCQSKHQPAREPTGSYTVWTHSEACGAVPGLTRRGQKRKDVQILFIVHIPCNLEN